MGQGIAYTAAYAEMVRYVRRGFQALRKREAATALDAFERSVELALTAGLGPKVIAGTRRNLALAYRDAGQLERAATTYRQLLSDPETPSGQRPYVLHGLGKTLALKGEPAGAALLLEAISLYQERDDILVASLDLGEYRLERGDFQTAYEHLSSTSLESDRIEHPELCCKLHLLLSRLAGKLRRRESARAHLLAAEAAAGTAENPMLQSLLLMVRAEHEMAEGQTLQARLHATQALEIALTHSEAETAHTLYSVAVLFLQVHERS